MTLKPHGRERGTLLRRSLELVPHQATFALFTTSRRHSSAECLLTASALSDLADNQKDQDSLRGYGDAAAWPVPTNVVGLTEALTDPLRQIADIRLPEDRGSGPAES